MIKYASKVLLKVNCKNFIYLFFFSLKLLLKDKYQQWFVEKIETLKTSDDE